MWQRHRTFPCCSSCVVINIVHTALWISTWLPTTHNHISLVDQPNSIYTVRHNYRNPYLSAAKISQYAVYSHKNFQAKVGDNTVWSSPKLYTTCTAFNVSLNMTSLWHHCLLVVNMIFTEEDKVAIKFLRENKHYGNKRFLKEFLATLWWLDELNRIFKKIDERLYRMNERCQSAVVSAQRQQHWTCWAAASVCQGEKQSLWTQT